MLIKITSFLTIVVALVVGVLVIISSNYVSYSIDGANKCGWNNGQRTGLTTLAFGSSIEKKLLTKDEELGFLKDSETKRRCVNKQSFYKTLIFVTKNKIGVVGDSEKVENRGTGY